jgi:ribosomal protein S12 methylthiotransferase accessory factor
MCRTVLERLDRADLDVVAWDITTDIGVPAFLCMVVDRTGEFSHTGRGAGCHPMREIALLRALTEAVQVRTTYIIGSREDIEHDDYRHETLQSRTRRVRALMRPVPTLRNFNDAGRFEFETFEAEVDWILERLQSVGIRQAVAIDLTRPEYGISVVRVVVPGIEGSDHHAGYSPGARARAMELMRP